jgi:hypothetical protein
MTVSFRAHTDSKQKECKREKLQSTHGYSGTTLILSERSAGVIDGPYLRGAAGSA